MAGSGKPDIPIEKFEGHLRGICRSSLSVNAKRSEMNGSVVTRKASDRVLTKTTVEAAFAARAKDPKTKAVLTKGDGDIDAVVDEIEIETFAYLSDDKCEFKDKTLMARRGRLVTLRGTPRELSEAAKNSMLKYVQRAHTINFPVTKTTGLSLEAPHPEPIAQNLRDETQADTTNVLIGIIDVGGFDFAHPDFVKEDKTRFVAIWDQGDDTFDPPKHQDGAAMFDFGSVLTSAHLDFAMIESQEPGGLPATEIMPQSQMTPGSHATHVASIAAGNHSLAANADIAGVLISLPDEDLDSRKSFYDTTRIVHAAEYLFNLADEMGKDGVSINISLGTNGGPHDDSSPMSRWIDYALTKPGRCVCVAAGNAGQEVGENSEDIGFMLGRIHTSGRIEATGLEHVIDWVVVGDGIEDISENELEIWYPPQDRFSIQVKPPGEPWMKIVAPGEFLQNIKLENDTFVSVFNKIYDPGNGHNRISVHLAPFFGDTRVVGIKPGEWRVRLIGTDIRDGRYHGWIERDDPVNRGRFGDREFWQFPSFFSERSNVDDSSVSTLACGDRIIAVGNLDEARQMINISSSQGPTRDGRTKPDIAAPGTNIFAANGFDPDALWVSKTGTSMASPYIAGLVGAMLSRSKELTSSQIMGIIRKTARPLMGSNFDWKNDAGFGVVNPLDCLNEAVGAAQMTDLDP